MKPIPRSIHGFLFVVAFFMLLLPKSLYAQEKNLADLQKTLNTFPKESTEAYQTRVEIAEYYFDRDALDSAQVIAERVEKFARNTNSRGLLTQAKKVKAKIIYKEGDYKKAIAQLDSIKSIFIQEKDVKNIVDALIYSSISNNIIGNNNAAIANLKEAEDYATEDFLQGIYNSYAQINISLDNSSKALEYLNKAISLGEKHPNTFEMAISYQTYANLNMSIGDNPKAIEYYAKAKELYEELNYTRGLFLVHNNAGTAAEAMDDFVTAKSMYRAAYEYSKKFTNPYASAVVLSNLAEQEEREDNFEGAIALFTESLTIIKEMGIGDTASSMAGQLAETYIKKEDYAQALNYAKESLSLAEKEGIDTLIREANKLLVVIYQKQGNHLAALNAQTTVLQLTDSLNTRERIREEAEQRSAFEATQKEQDIKLKQQEIETLKQREKLSRYMYLLGGIGLLLLLTLLYRQIKLTKTERKVVEMETALSTLKQKQLQETVTQKKGQVTNFALHIKEKNEHLDHLKTSISKVRKKATDALVRSELQQILGNINNYVRINQNRVDLLSEVNSTNDEFLTTLGSRFPTLTDREKNIAGLIRLNMSSKQIAENLNLTEMSLNNLRSKIRKKLDIKKGTTLQSFLKEL